MMEVLKYESTWIFRVIEGYPFREFIEIEIYRVHSLFYMLY